jgi:hypothetical protein
LNLKITDLFENEFNEIIESELLDVKNSKK